MTWRTRVVTWRGSVRKVLLKVLQKSQKNISAGVLFLIKIQAGDLPPRLHYWYYFVNSAKFLKTPFKNFKRLLWKSLFVKLQVFPVKTDVLYISFNFFANLLFLRMSQETKTCSKIDKKRHKNCFSLCYSSVFIISFVLILKSRSLFFNAFATNSRQDYVMDGVGF